MSAPAVKKALFLLCVMAGMAPAEEFVGTVECLKSGQLGFENQGRIAYVQNVGTKVSSAIFDEADKLVCKGDIVAKQDTAHCEAVLTIAEADMKHAESDLTEKRSEFERSKMLVSRNALSKKQLEQTENEYNKSLATMEKVKAALRIAKYNLEACYLRAPFDGEIEEMLSSEGTWVDQGIPVVKLIGFEVMKIVVELPEVLSRRICLVNRIGVMSPLDGSRLRPVWTEDGMTESRALNIYIRNRKVPVYPLGDKEKGLPVVERLSFAIDMNGEDFRKTIWLHEDAVMKDSGGEFVWFAKGQNLEAKESGVERSFAVAKRYVKTFAKYKTFGLHDYQCIENPGDIKLYDIVLVLPPKDLKDGERVVYQPSRWLLRHGDKVKVVID